jgi:ADP-heptose:LPS heptosyltransferase
MSELQTVLVSRLRFMGDVILTTPLLRALKEHKPGIRIVYLAETPFHTLVEHHPHVDIVLGFDPRSFSTQLPVIRTLLKTRFSAAIDLFGNPRSAILTLASGAPVRIGGDFRGRKAAYTHKIRDDGKLKTAVQFHMRYLEPLGIHAVPADPLIHVTEEEVFWAESFIGELGMDRRKPRAAVHAGASWPSKRWFPERFAELAARLIREKGAQILLTTSPGEEALAETVRQACPEPLPPPLNLPLRRLAAILQRMDLFVSNDCGPMHLAPAVGTPVVGIFGPGEPEIWFPYSAEKGHRFIHAEIECSRCHRDFCDSLECMKAVTVDMVLNAAGPGLALGMEKRRKHSYKPAG